MMSRLLPALCAGLSVALAHAQQPAAPDRSGYAFDTPRILAQQRLFGIAHGVSLLAATCREVPEAASASEAGYALWRVQQAPAIEAAQADLGEFYFGKRDTSQPDIAKKLGLKEGLGLAPDSEALRAACASLPEALAQPRYNLNERFRLEEMMARTVEATEIEARERSCRSVFANELLELHDARYQLWREINLPALEEAKQALTAAWPADAPAPSFDEWYADLRRRTQAQGRLGLCIAFSESLKLPEAALRNVFRMPAPIAAPSAAPAASDINPDIPPVTVPTEPQ